MDLIDLVQWRPGIGDPSLMGWVTVAAYALAAITALGAARRARRLADPADDSRAIWIAVATLMALLCVNKQLDLQSLLTDVGRVIARRDGWYDHRRDVQKWFLAAAVGTALVMSVFVLVAFREFWARHVLLAAGLLFLLTFIAVRAISFHHFDEVLGTTLIGMRVNWILELGGIGMIGWAALRSERPSRSRRSRGSG
jgi:hypothetical protein